MGFLSSLFGLGGSKSQPSTSTVIQAQELPKEIAPFVKEVVGEAQELYKHRLGEGYVPFAGETIAPLTSQEEAAMAGIEGLVGLSRPLQEEALTTTRGLAEKFTPETAEAYMSPYQRAVTDIEKREAERRFEREVMPRFEAQAIAQGGLSGLGSRAGVESAELQRGQSQLMADIEAKGLQSAFQNAQQQFAQQKAREAQMATEIGRTGPAMLASGLQEAGALQTIGEERRDLAQSALDEAYFRFLEEQRFPEQTLAEYSGFVYGNPMAQMPTTTQQSTGTPYQPSLGQTLLGVGSTLGAAALRNPYVTQKMFKGGGYIDRDRGLSGLPMFRRQENGQVVDEDDRPELIQMVQKGIDAIMPDFSESNALAKELRRLNPNYMYADDEEREALVKQARENLGFDPEYGAVDRVSLEEARANAAKYKERVDAQRNKRAKELLQRIGTDQGDVSALKRQEVKDFFTLVPASEAEATREKTSAAIQKVDDTQKEKERVLAENKLISKHGPGLPGDFQEGAVEEVEDVKINISAKTAKEKATKKQTLKEIANQPSEGSLRPMTEEEAAAKYDANPADFGGISKEQLLKDTADYNKKYMDIINRIYPEAQNEFLADALQALGAMFVAENKGEAFIKTFNDLQKAGMKRRDARRIALGRAALENLKSDKATLDKIRQLPKQRRDAILSIIERREQQKDRVGTRAYRKAMKELAESKGKYFREGGARKTTKAGLAPKADLKTITPLLTDQTFYASALKAFPLPIDVFATTGDAAKDKQARQELVKRTLSNTAAQQRIGNRAKQLERLYADKGTTLDPTQALKKATSDILKEIYMGGQVGIKEGMIFGWNTTGLDE